MAETRIQLEEGEQDETDDLNKISLAEFSNGGRNEEELKNVTALEMTTEIPFETGSFLGACIE